MPSVLYDDENDNEGNINKRKQLEENKIGDEEFICFCGVRLKHIPDKPPDVKTIACKMYLIDEALALGPFHCDTHKVNICGMCAVSCHKKCLKSNVVLPGANDDHFCHCHADKHSQVSEVEFAFPLKEYQKFYNFNENLHI